MISNQFSLRNSITELKTFLLFAGCVVEVKAFYKAFRIIQSFLFIVQIYKIIQSNKIVSVNKIMSKRFQKHYSMNF